MSLLGDDPKDEACNEGVAMSKGIGNRRFAVFFPSLLVCSLLLVGLAQSASADTLEYVFTGTASGTIGGTPFTDATLTVSVVGDTSNIMYTYAYFLDAPGGAAMFSIGGLGTGTFNDGTYVFDNQTAFGGTVGFGDGSDDIQIHDADFGSTVFSTYDLSYPIGPLGFVTDPSTSDWVNLPTSLGGMTVTSYTDVSFQAIAAPEPGSLLMLGTGLLVLAGAMRKKLRPGANIAA